MIYAYASPRDGWTITNDVSKREEVGTLRFQTVQEAVDQITEWTSAYTMDVRWDR